MGISVVLHRHVVIGVLAAFARCGVGQGGGGMAHETATRHQNLVAIRRNRRRGAPGDQG
jgi:hypothetical protein